MLTKKLLHGTRVLAAVFFLLCTQLYAQYDNGSLGGTIRDGSGAAVAGAKVTITNNDTGAVSTATTNGSGDYEAPTLRVGTYSISAAAPGMAAAEAKNIAIQVGGRERIDLALK